jgi:hypothetical protein
MGWLLKMNWSRRAMRIPAPGNMQKLEKSHRKSGLFCEFARISQKIRYDFQNSDWNRDFSGDLPPVSAQ